LPVVPSSNMLVEDSLLDGISLPEGIIDILELVSARHLVVGVQRMRAPDRGWALLQGVRLTTDDVRSDVCLLHVLALSRVEASYALGRSGTAKDIRSLQGGLLELFVLASWRQHIWNTSRHLTYRTEISSIISVSI
jgi:hypothetical protein